MTVVNLAQPAPPEPKRDRFGRYLIPDPETGEERSWTRATTISATLAEKFGLQQWSQRMTALGLAKRPDLYARVASCTPDDKNALNRLVDEAKEAAAASAGANLGTALHRFTERLDRGEDVQAPSPLDRDLDAYRKVLTEAGFEVVDGMIEQVVTVPVLQVAGTFDRVGTLAGRGLPMVADLKTGQWLGFDEIALQLALYANAATIYDLAAEKHRPMPEVDRDRALVIHLPAGKATCTLWLVDIAAGWEAVQQAMWVRDWRKRKDLASTLTSAAVPAVVEEVAGPAVSTVQGAQQARLLDGLVGGNLRRKVEAMTGEQRDRLAKELAARGLPKLSAAGPEHASAWCQAVKAVLPAPQRPQQVVLPSGTTMHRPVTRDWLHACVVNLQNVDGGIDALRHQLEQRWLPGLSDCPDELLDEWADACSAAERTVRAPFPPMVDEISPAPPVGEPVDAAAEHLPSAAASAPPAVAAEHLPSAVATVITGVVAELVDGLDDDMVETLRVECGEGRPWDAWTAADVERLRVMVAAIDRCVVAFTYDGERPVLMSTDTAYDTLLETHGGKAGVLAAARQHAKTAGLASPRTTVAAAGDPRLVAELTKPSA